MFVSAVFLLVTTSFNVVTSSSPITIPYGTAAGDRVLLQDQANALSGKKFYGYAIPIFGQYHKYFFVWSNGYISVNGTQMIERSFGLPHTPLYFPIIAPYLADVDTRIGGAVYHREIADGSEAMSISQMIIDAHPSFTGFMATSAFCYTWDDVAFRGASATGATKRNRFQTIIAYDQGLDDTYIIFSYEKLEWTSAVSNRGDRDTGLGGFPALAGVDDGDFHFSLPFSYSNRIRELVTTSNVGNPGRWIYKISEYFDPGKGKQYFVVL